MQRAAISGAALFCGFALCVAMLLRSSARADDPEVVLTGQLLIASAEMTDPRFAESVVYIVKHNNEGTLGLVINQPIAKGSMQDLLKGFGIANDNARGEIILHYGGPVSQFSGFVLHTDDVKLSSTISVKDGIAMTTDPKIIELIGEGKAPRQYLLMMGYAGWAPGQLEGEILAGAWHTIPADKALIFDQDVDKKWHRAMERRQVPL